MTLAAPLSGASARAVSITTVQTPATGDATNLIDLATVKSALSITNTENDAFLKKLIGFASTAIGQYCNRVFPVETILDQFWPQRDTYPYQVPGGIAPLQLSRWPLVDVASVTENDIDLVEDTDFRVDAERGLLVRLDGNGYPAYWPAYKVEVTYDAGYKDIPGDVQDAALRLVSARWMAKGRDPFTRSVDIPGVRSVQYWVPDTPTGNMTPDVQDLLDNYRVPVIA